LYKCGWWKGGKARINVDGGKVERRESEKKQI